MNTDKWINKIDETTASFKKEFGNLSAEELNRKPKGDAWSIGQNLDHLIVINETYYPVMKAIREGKYKLPFIAKMGFMVNLSGKMILGAVKPDRGRKMKTMPIWEPSKSEIAGDILIKFGKHQDELKKLIVNCSDLLDKGVVISSPANNNIVYKLETAFDIIVMHEERHLQQARETWAQLNKPATGAAN